MTVFDLDPNLSWGFFFAHPDDELAIAIWMQRLIQAGASVRAFWAHSTAVRRQESISVMNEVGLIGDQPQFEEFPDGGFVDELPELCKWVRGLAEQNPFDRVVCASFEQGHLDHDALNFAVTQSFPKTSILDFPEYWPYGKRLKSVRAFSGGIDGERLKLTVKETQAKRKWARMYPSQRIFALIRAAEFRERLMFQPPKLRTEECLRFQPPIDYLHPAHPPKRAIRIRETNEWRRWSAAICELEANCELVTL